jgi:hypothetical protein
MVTRRPRRPEVLLPPPRSVLSNVIVTLRQEA